MASHRRHLHDIEVRKRSETDAESAPRSSWSYICSDKEARSSKAANVKTSSQVGSKSFVFVYGENDDSLVKSFRNLSNSKLTSVTKLSTYDVISNEALVFSENAINTFLEQR